MTFTREQLARLPYQQTPAAASDVAEEVTKMVGVIAGIFAAVPDPKEAAHMIADGTKEPGRMVVIQQTRLALAVESFVSDSIESLVRLVADAAEKGTHA